jgi:hypothetical protein
MSPPFPLSSTAAGVGAALSTLLLTAAASSNPLPPPKASSLTLPSFFSDGVVLQVYDEGDARSFVFGTASPAGAVVQLTLTSSVATLPFSRTYSTRSALPDGGWAFQIDGTYAPDAEHRHGPHYGPYSITVTSGNSSTTFRDGEWRASPANARTCL